MVNDLLRLTVVDVLEEVLSAAVVGAGGFVSELVALEARAVEVVIGAAVAVAGMLESVVVGTVVDDGAVFTAGVDEAAVVRDGSVVGAWSVFFITVPSSSVSCKV